MAEPGARVVVTGASRGIGAAVARGLDVAGYAVIGLSRTGRSAAGQGIACDMADEQAVRRAFADLASAPGSLVGLVNNAGTHGQAPTAELETGEYERVMRVNATAVMIAAREAHALLVRSGGGLIVNMGSFFDKLGVREHLAYCASKAAVGAITRCLAVEWADHGISVVNIAPGYVETDFNRGFLTRASVRKWIGHRVPLRRTGTAEEVARLVVALFAADAPYLTGETIYLDGGHGVNH